MNLADVFTFLFVILGFVIVFVCYWLAAAGLQPEFVQRAAQRLEKRPFSMLGLGLITLIPLMAVGIKASNSAGNGVVKIIALSLVVVPLLAALFGSAGWALRVGAGLKSERDQAEPWRRVLRGGIVVGITFVLPFIGTFVVLPFVFLSGFGAFLLSWRVAKAVAIAPAPAMPLPPVPLSPAPAPMAQPVAAPQPAFSSSN